MADTPVPQDSQQSTPPRKNNEKSCQCCRKRKVKCNGDYDFSKGGRCDTCARLNRNCGPREKAQGKRSSTTIEPERTHPSLASQAPSPPATAPRQKNTFARIKPHPASASKETLKRDIANLIVALLYIRWKHLIARVFDQRPADAGAFDSTHLRKLKDNLKHPCDVRIQQLNQELDKRFTDLKSICYKEYQECAHLLQLDVWARDTTGPWLRPPLKSSATYPAEIWALYQHYQPSQTTLAALFLVELLRTGGYQHIVDDEHRLRDAFAAFEHLGHEFTRHYQTTDSGGKLLSSLAGPPHGQDTIFSPLLLLEQFGFHELGDALTHACTDARGHLVGTANVCDLLSRTPFHVRADSPYAHLTPAFLKFHGRAIDIRDSFNMTPGLVAASSKNESILNTLLSDFDTHVAGHVFDPGVLYALKSLGLLSIACQNGHAEFVRLLLRTIYGPDRNSYMYNTSPRALDDQMPDSFLNTIKGCGEDHAKLAIIERLAYYGARPRADSEPLSKVVRKRRCDILIQDRIDQLETQWDADAKAFYCNATQSNQMMPVDFSGYGFN